MMPSSTRRTRTTTSSCSLIVLSLLLLNGNGNGSNSNNIIIPEASAFTASNNYAVKKYLFPTTKLQAVDSQQDMLTATATATTATAVVPLKTDRFLLLTEEDGDDDDDSFLYDDDYRRTLFATTTVATAATTATTATTAATSEQQQQQQQQSNDSNAHESTESLTNNDTDSDGTDSDDTEDDDTEDDTEDNENMTDEEREAIRRRAMKKLLLSGNARRSSYNTKTTSVGARRVGGASKARAGLSKSTQLLTAVRRAAAANKSIVTKEENDNDDDEEEKKKNNETNNNNNNKPSMLISKNAINASIESFMSSTATAKKTPTTTKVRTAGVDYEQRARTMGLLGAVDEATLAISHPLLQTPPPGTILIQPTTTKSTSTTKSTKTKNKQRNKNKHVTPTPNNISKDSLTVRCATHFDDTDIAYLRLSVFSDFSPELRQQFCSRSKQVLSNRRLRGATCLVATDDQQRLVGSLECSVHEFHYTSLGFSRKADSIMYITEVAVSPYYRRCGVGSKLMQAVDELATKHRNVESLYLHVDVTNEGALQLYEQKMGFSRITNGDSRYNEFTTSLNLHDGATRGRNHYLLCKHLTPTPTWLPLQQPKQQQPKQQQPKQQQQQPIGCRLESESSAVGLEIS